VAYTREGVPDITKRPVSFVYNGGPGEASVDTHMGLGPRRVVLTDDGHGLPAPYSATENGDSFLDATDLVFVDAIATGYSRPAPGEKPAQFFGIVQDANYFADFIYQYLTRTERWGSPKFLIGESYGTIRSAQLASVLQQRHFIYLNGIVLVSAVAFSNWGADDRFKFSLPSYTTSAWYHHRLPPDLQKLTIEEVAQQARQFAHGDYAAALEKGDGLSSGAPEDCRGPRALQRPFAEVRRAEQSSNQSVPLAQGARARQAQDSQPDGLTFRGDGRRCRRRAK
jgi:carboxypeptidase C (cathepsin A)